MNIEEIEHRLRDAVRVRPTPETRESQMQAVLSRREAGERVVLPTDPRHRSGVVRWVIVAATAAAASLALATGLSTPGKAAPEASRAGQSGFFGVEMLYAQSTDHPTFPIIRIRSSLPARSWTYGLREPGDSAVDSTSIWRAERGVDSYEQQPAYRYAYSGSVIVGDLSLVDSLWLDRESLRPIARQSTTLSGSHVIQIFKETSVLNGITTATGWTNWMSVGYNIPFLVKMRDGTIKKIPAKFLTTAAQIGTWRHQISAALEAADLNSDWRGSTEIFAASGYWASRFWLNFQVIGEERITVPAGTFDAWKVKVDEDGSYLAWVSKEGHQILKMAAGQGRTEEVLLKTETLGE